MNPRTHWCSHLLPALSLSIAAAAVGLFGPGIAAQQRGGPPQEQDPSAEPLKFRYMGPPSAGRISAVVAIPGNQTTYYAGAASGGIWKSIDSGKTFEPIFDDQSVAAIGALAVAPSDPNIVWVGTGES